MSEHYRIRPMLTTDLRFVRSSWRRSYHRALPVRDESIRNAIMTERMDAIAESGAKVLVACCPNDPDYIVAWCCYDPGRDLLHYVYVREVERRRGVAKALAKEAKKHTGGDLVVTHWTPVCEKITRKHTLFYEPSHLEQL